jgi:transcriptional regulator
MYNLPYHKEQDPAAIDALIREFPLAFVAGCDTNNHPISTQIPLYFEEINGKRVLRGHIMKGTDHHLAFEQNPNVLAVFTGRNTYVSGSWYKNPHTPSTWNYTSVHIKGKIRFVEAEEVKDILQQLSVHFEGGDSSSPTVYQNLPETFQEKALEFIAGFEIEISAIDTVFKLSQDRDAESYRNIIEKLKAKGVDGQSIANEMEKREKELFAGKG